MWKFLFLIGLLICVLERGIAGAPFHWEDSKEEGEEEGQLKIEGEDSETLWEDDLVHNENDRAGEKIQVTANPSSFRVSSDAINISLPPSDRSKKEASKSMPNSFHCGSFRVGRPPGVPSHSIFSSNI